MSEQASSDFCYQSPYNPFTGFITDNRCNGVACDINSDCHSLLCQISDDDEGVCANE